MAHRRLKKIVPVILSATSIMLVGCNSGTTSANQNNSLNVATSATSSVSTSATTLAGTAISSRSVGDDSCVKATFKQTQNSNQLNSSLVISNSCNYAIPLGGYKINFSSEYIDDIAAQIESLNYVYKNGNNKNRTYSLKLSSHRYTCPNGNGSAEMLMGTLNARKIKAGSSITLTGTTTLGSSKIYDLPLAKSTFKILTPDSVIPNELGLYLSDPESYNYSNVESGSRGRDSLSTIPLNQFGLKTVMISNNTCNNMESIIPTLSLPKNVFIDKLRTTCKLNGSQYLQSEQNCRYVLHYDPSINDLAQPYESVVSIDAYAKLSNSNTISRSESYLIPYSTKGKIAGQQIVKNKLNILDNKITTTGLANVSIGSFGIKKYTVTNSSNITLESMTFSYAPNAYGLPEALIYDTTRMTCKTDGSQKLLAGQSCTVVIKYTPSIQLVNESTVIQVVAYAQNSNKTIVYTSGTDTFNYSTASNYTSSILPISVNYIRGFDIDDTPSVTFNNNISKVMVGSFGLKAFTVTNDTGENLYNINLANIDELNSLPVLKIDTTRSSCKFTTVSTINNFSLKDGQSCLLVFKYSPTVANLQQINYDFTVSGYSSGGNKIQSDISKVIGTSK